MNITNLNGTTCRGVSNRTNVDLRPRSNVGTNGREGLLSGQLDNDGVVLVKYLVARVHEELYHVVQVLAMRKGLDGANRMGTEELHLNKKRTTCREVGDVSREPQLSQRGLHRSPVAGLVSGGGVVEVGAARTVAMGAPSTQEETPPGDSHAPLDRRVPDHREGEGGRGGGGSDKLHHRFHAPNVLLLLSRNARTHCFFFSAKIKETIRSYGVDCRLGEIIGFR
jgi:hypothetical protein